MGVLSANQHLRVYVSTAAPKVVADTSATPLEKTGLAAGEVTYVPVGETATVAIPPTDKDFRVAYKDLSGHLFFSPTVKVKDVISIKTEAGVAESQQVANLTIDTPIDEGANYMVKLRVPNYGGLISPQDEVYFYGNYTAKSGDGAPEVATGLADSLKKAVEAAPVPFVDVTASAGEITVTGLEQPYVRAKFDGRFVRFDLTLSRPEHARKGQDAGSTAGFPGRNTGKQVASAEEFYAGYNEGYKNRFGDYPYDTQPILAADVTKSYTSDTIIFATKREGSNVVSQRQVIQVFHTPS